MICETPLCGSEVTVVIEVACGTACLCHRCAADLWAFLVTGEGFERNDDDI